jgi:hypothetical protein
MTALHDGQMILTSMPTEVLATIYVTLHETKHSEPKGLNATPIPTGNLSKSEEDLYEAAGAELNARIRDTAERRGEEKK